MTEEEAKTKWCPVDHWSSPQHAGGKAPNCIGSPTQESTIDGYCGLAGKP